MPPQIDWQQIWVAIAFALGFVIRKPPALQPDEREAPDREDDDLFHKTYAGLPPWGFWLTLASLVTGVAVSFVRLTFEVEDLRRWKDMAQSTRFTNRDWDREKLTLMKEIELERTFTRSLCYELSRVTRELGKLPSNDCNRP